MAHNISFNKVQQLLISAHKNNPHSSYFLLSDLLDHSNGVDVPFHLGAGDGHQATHRAEGLLAHVAVQILQSALQETLLGL